MPSRNLLQRVPVPNRFSLTALDAKGDRVLTRDHRFQYHRDTRAEADDLLACILRKHTPVELCEICGPHAATIEVREIQCYYGGSAIFTSGFDQRRLGADMLVDGE